jgi:hypothetical protein
MSTWYLIYTYEIHTRTPLLVVRSWMHCFHSQYHFSYYSFLIYMELGHIYYLYLFKANIARIIGEPKTMSTVGQLSHLHLSSSIHLPHSSLSLLFTDLEPAGPSPAKAGLDPATADPDTVAESLELDAAA